MLYKLDLKVGCVLCPWKLFKGTKHNQIIDIKHHSNTPGPRNGGCPRFWRWCWGRLFHQLHAVSWAEPMLLKAAMLPEPKTGCPRWRIEILPPRTKALAVHDGAQLQVWVWWLKAHQQLEVTLWSWACAEARNVARAEHGLTLLIGMCWSRNAASQACCCQPDCRLGVYI